MDISAAGAELSLLLLARGDTIPRFGVEAFIHFEFD
jgi:hypothetical protein